MGYKYRHLSKAFVKYYKVLEEEDMEDIAVEVLGIIGDIFGVDNDLPLEVHSYTWYYGFRYLIYNVRVVSQGLSLMVRRRVFDFVGRLKSGKSENDM